MKQELHASALSKLLNFSVSVGELKQSLAQLDWDSESVTDTLKLSHVASVLARCADKSLSFNDVETWANFIEGREDICFDPSRETTIAEIVYELANPLLTTELTLQRTDELIKICASTTGEKPPS